MTYRGHVRNGQITLDEPTPLPEGAEVNVQILQGSDRKPVRHLDRRKILQMPLEQRRDLLTEQSAHLASHYASEADRIDWQAGDILE